MADTAAVELVLKRDRLVVMMSLIFVFVVSAAYTILGIGMEMSAVTMTRMAIEMPGMAMQSATWSPGYALLVFLMWWVMMIAMMLPSAAPMVLLHAAVGRKQAANARPLAATIMFLAGYLSVWAAFSAGATLLQWALERLGAVTGMMELASPILGGVVLIAAGVFQFTPLKHACLKHCQHPVIFIARHWRSGERGAWRMGLVHGAYCLGCCWFLMVLLFVGGIMNLLWIGGIALYVAIEKFAAGRRWVTTLTGIALTLGGILMLARPLLST